MNEKFLMDYKRTTKEEYNSARFLFRYFKNHNMRYMFWGRKLAESNSNITKHISQLFIRRYKRLYGLEINLKNCGGGLRLIHPWMITVNDNAVIGENVTLYKGCTIGEIVSGKKQGNPLIGNNVTVYANATICGNITIGDNSIVSAGSFVNFDVPNNSIVIGNPGSIHSMK